MKCRNTKCCQGLTHTAQLKVCNKCKQAINGWNCTLCPKCSLDMGQCGHCLSPLKTKVKKKTKKKTKKKLMKKKPIKQIKNPPPAMPW